MDTVFLNGHYLPRSEARLSVDDRGFLFGDGVYEVIPLYGGQPFLVDRHLERLRRGLLELAIPFHVAEAQAIRKELVSRNDLSGSPMAVLYLQITRGAAPRTHHFPPEGTSPTVYAFAIPYGRPERAVWEKGASAITCPDRRWGRVDIKTLQLLPNVLAQQAAVAAGASDAIMIRDGLAVEGGHSNLFLVFGRTVRTHPASNQILPGITRGAVLEIARELGYEVEECPTAVERLPEATEVFLTGTTAEIRPIVRVDGRGVGDGGAGPVTRELYEGLLERIATECPAVTAGT